MSGKRTSAVPGILLRALGFGVVGSIALPVIAALGALAAGHLAGACGPGSSGGCEMGAALLGIYAIVPGFVLGAGWSVVRDFWKTRA